MANRRQAETIPDPQVIIVGSGPAGVSAAWPLVRAGVVVLMLDAAGGAIESSPSADSASGFRADPRRWRAQFGDDLGGLEPGGERSPKLATPVARSVTAGYAEALGLETRGFFAAGALARGGLSTIWGALAAELPMADLAVYPGGAEGMRPFYDAARARIGAPRPSAETITSAAARRVFEHLQRRGRDVAVEPAPNAVLQAPMGGREPCIQCGLCLWGCSRRAIYASGDELPALGRFPNFEYRCGHRVRRLFSEGGLQALEIEAGAERLILRAKTVLLAAGTIATAALALPRLGLIDRPAPLLTNPAAVTAFVVPALIGAELPQRSHSLGQLLYRLRLPGAEAAGVLYGADALPLELVAARLPLSRPVALRVARAVAPAMVLATCYLPGRFSRNRLTATVGGVRIEGEQSANATALLSEALGRLKRAIFPAAVPLPGATSILEPGADAHYAGVLPMGCEGPFASGAFGEIADGLHVVDGACLPALSSTHPTLTIMANAARIGEAVAKSLGGAA